VEKRAVDGARDVAGLTAEIEGCDVVFNCVGLPPDLMHLHPVIARNVVAAAEKSGVRCVLVSSFWSFLPVVSLPLNESHPRNGGPLWSRLRREAEDILRDAGAAVVHLPDFYGPNVHVSLLQQPIEEAFSGKTMNWIGARDTVHEYIFVPDAMAMVVRLAAQPAAYGENWIFPGGGPVTGGEIANIAGQILGRKVELRSAGPLLLRLVSLVQSDLRGFMPLVPEYLKPITYDASKLSALLGSLRITPYEEGIRQTIDWLRANAESPTS
jgi:nucleoside-diphosphate-sugar epimerase